VTELLPRGLSPYLAAGEPAELLPAHPGLGRGPPWALSRVLGGVA